MAFVHRRINVSFSLANGQFQGGGNTAKLTNHRITCKMKAPGGATMTIAEIGIYGLPLSMMNQLSTIGPNFGEIDKNTVSVEAGDDVTGMKLIFKGTINSAFVDAQSMPEVCLRVMAHGGLYEATMPAKPISVKGSASVPDLMGKIAKVMNFQFENNGVDSKVTNPYLHGSPRSMAVQLAKMAGIEWVIDRDVVAIWPSNSKRSGEVLISPQTGMVGYPAFNQAQLLVRTLYDPNLTFGAGINVKSDITPACGKWSITDMDVSIESETPRGQWFAVLTGNKMGSAPVKSAE